MTRPPESAKKRSPSAPGAKPPPEAPVIAEEHEEIARRRNQVFDKRPGWTAEEVKDDLVGLALSGGGIRSAMFNLGLLQALHERGLFRYFDYLSTVSGGSYIGAQLSSQLHREGLDPPPGGSGPFPRALRREEDGSQPKRVCTFIRNGNYLGKPWEFAVHYLIGLALNLVVFTSGLLFVCALVALCWRALDMPWLRDQMAFNPAQRQDWLRWWTQDLQRAFLPSAFFFLVYGALWLAKRRAAGRTPDPSGGGWAETLVALALLLSLFACLALWLIPLVPLEGQPWPGTPLFLACWVGVLAIGLVAWSVRLWFPHWLARLTAWARWTAWLSLLVGGVVLLGNGDTGLGPFSYLIPDRYLIYNPRYENHSILDFSFLPDFVKVIGYVLVGVAVAVIVLLALLPFVAPRKVFASGQRPDQPRSLYLFRVIATATLLGVPLLTLYLLARENVSGEAGRGKLLGLKVDERWEAWGLPQPVGVRIARRPSQLVGVVGVVEEADDLELLPNSEPAPNTIELALSGPWPAFAAPGGPPGYQEVTYSLVYPWSRHGRRTGSETILPLALAPSQSREARTVVLQPSRGAFLPEDLDLFWIDIAYLEEATRPEDVEDVADLVDIRPVYLGILAANRPNVAKSSAADQGPVLTSEEQRFHQWLKAKFYGPDADLDLVEQDQLTRLQVLLIALPVFLLSGFLVSFNWTSLHRFYRNRLAEAYIEPAPEGDRRIALSGLDNPAVGGPYHLISATLHLIGYRRSDERNWTYLFSPRYCGSQVTGYRPTHEALGDYDDLAAVTALSGAAVSAAQSEDLPTAILMTLTNFQLGQWLPHPAQRQRQGLPSAFALLADFALDAEDRARCFLTDGGNSENLGLWPLLQRRCRLIVVSDASQDERHSLGDFLKLCRRIRLYHGVQFFDLSTNRPIDLEAIQRREDQTSRYHFFVGRVCYPAGFMGEARPGEGYLIYLKPSLTLDEELDLLRHFRHFPPFPHDPTLEQLYDEDKVESYRQLGHHIGETLCHRVGGVGLGPGGRLPATDLFWQCLAPDLARVVAEERRTDEALRRWKTDPAFRRQVARRVEELLNPPSPN